MINEAATVSEISLAERCIQLTKRLEVARQNRVEAERSRVRQARYQPLKEAVDFLVREVDAIQALSSIGIKYQTNGWNIEPQIKRWRQLEKQYQHDPDTLKKDNREWQMQTETVKRFATELRKESDFHWHTYAENEIPKGSSGTLLTVMERLPNSEDKVRNIRNMTAQLKSQVLVRPKNTMDITKFRTDTQQLKKLWIDFESKEIPQGVLRVLTAVGAGHAPLSLLTEEVMIWLRSQGLENLFEVSLVQNTPPLPVERRR